MVDGNVVHEKLATGRTGYYYRLDSSTSVETLHSRDRAIKFIPFDQAKEDYLAELASISLIHPAIVRIESGGQYRELKVGPLEVFPGDQMSEKATTPSRGPSRYRYLIMEWLSTQDQESKSFKQLIVDGGLASKLLLPLAHPLFEALAYAHRKGFVHGKLHPANLLLTRDGQPKISKFRTPASEKLGLAPILELDAEWANYIAPEQLQRSRSTGPSADLYSLAVILYELLSGHLPHQGNPIIGHLAGESQALPSRDDISTELQAWFEIALQKEAYHRFSDIEQAGDALRKALTS